MLLLLHLPSKSSANRKPEMKLAAPSITGRPFLALLWLLSVSSLPSLSSAQSAAELLALASRVEGSVTITKTKANVTAPVDLSLVSYETGSATEGDGGSNAADGDDADADAGDGAHDLQLGNITSVDQGLMDNVTAHDASDNTIDAMPEDESSISISQVPTDMVPETGPADDAPAVMSNEPIDNNIESANVVSPDSYAATSGSISYLRRGRRQLAAKRRR